MEAVMDCKRGCGGFGAPNESLCFCLLKKLEKKGHAWKQVHKNEINEQQNNAVACPIILCPSQAVVISRGLGANWCNNSFGHMKHGYTYLISAAEVLSSSSHFISEDLVTRICVRMNLKN